MRLKMAFKSTALLVLFLHDFALAVDIFNYDRTSGTNYGPADWDEVSCSNLDTCVSFYICTMYNSFFL